VSQRRSGYGEHGRRRRSDQRLEQRRDDQLAPAQSEIEQQFALGPTYAVEQPAGQEQCGERQRRTEQKHNQHHRASRRLLSMHAVQGHRQV
jgi:hypothetical protein